MVTNLQGMSRTKVTPVPVVRSTRVVDLRVLTSLPVGKVVPIAAFGLLREDQVASSRIRINFEMLETVEILMNAVFVNVKAYLVPYLAFDRFNGIDSLNRSYAKIPDVPAGPVTPFITTHAFSSTACPILTYMGKHAREAQAVNAAYTEAYNVIWNFRAANRSPDIAQRVVTNATLAKAFWNHSQFAHIVPDFDQAIIDGEVPLNVVNGQLQVKGTGGVTTGGGVKNLWSITAPAVTTVGSAVPPAGPNAAPTPANARMIGWQGGGTAQPPFLDFAGVYAELAENGITVSLSNVEMARKTQAFALLRKQYTGFSDDYIIDLLMNGVTVPEQAWRQPMLIADRSTIFGMSKRYSSTADDLTASVVNGATFIDLPMVTPRVPTGGVVMITVEITPEQLFERRQDPFLHTVDQGFFPEFMRDTLDPEKVEVVENQFIDVDHATPTATFGYAPLNHKWNGMPPGIGGKFYRPKVNTAFDEDRQRIWAVETVNPTLSEDFYLCTNMHMKPFVVTNQDNFEAVARGLVKITGNTVFGNVLLEATDDYETVMGEAPIDRIDKPASMHADEEGKSDDAANSQSE